MPAEARRPRTTSTSGSAASPRRRWPSAACWARPSPSSSRLQMENLQDADRFYYLSRVQGLNLLNELENNSFAEMVMRNTDLGDDRTDRAARRPLLGARPCHPRDGHQQAARHADPVSDDPFLRRLLQAGRARRRRQRRRWPSTSAYNSNDHVVIGGTESDDTHHRRRRRRRDLGRRRQRHASRPATASTRSIGGEGDDIITNAGTDIGEADFLHGESGNDVIHGG